MPTEQGEDIQEQRLPQLLDTVARRALCASPAPGIPAPDDWYRGDGEPLIEWRRRRGQLLTVCAACPVRPACEESALRQGEGTDRADSDMVRGGRTAAELYDARTTQARRLDAAAEEDDRARREEQLLRTLMVRLREQALVHQTPKNTKQNNIEVRGTVQAIATVRTVRRGRAGWSSAA